MTPSAVAVIRPAALQANLNRVRTLAPGCRVLAVIKANAYGHGLVPVAQILDGADALAIARLEEARQLREAGIGKRIVLLGGCATAGELGAAAELSLDVVVHTALHIELLEAAPASAPVWCWLKIDTGMGRLGIEVAEARDAMARLARSKAVAGVTLMTHFSCADDRGDAATSRQFDAFASVAGDWPGDVSLANSAAILQWPETLSTSVRLNYGGDNWVRPGLMLFGASPLPAVTASSLGLRPAMSFESRLISVKSVPRGRWVGYGGCWQADRETTIGIAAAGYADGYPWRVRPGTTVRVNGVAAPLVGRVSMDMITVDLTAVPGARIGDPVVLWGDGPTVEELAVAADTIPWTLMTGIGRRVMMRLDAAGTVTAR